jgi:hypothetical protein
MQAYGLCQAKEHIFITKGATFIYTVSKVEAASKVEAP